MRLSAMESDSDILSSQFSYWVLANKINFFVFQNDISSFRKLEKGFNAFNSLSIHDNLNDYAKMSLGLQRSYFEYLSDEFVDKSKVK